MKDHAVDYVEKIEALLLKAFRTEPFHNLFYLGLSQPSRLKGGTCSDKVLAFQETLAHHGIRSRLHTALLPKDWRDLNAGFNECHRVLIIDIRYQRYVADVGNGWPSCRLFSMQRQMSYSAFGITFSTELSRDYLDIYQYKQGQKTLSVRVPKILPPESVVHEAIARRFDNDKTYPFANGLRYAQIMGEQFYFLRKNRLEIYSAQGNTQKILSPNRAVQFAALQTTFGLTPEVLNPQ